MGWDARSWFGISLPIDFCSANLLLKWNPKDHLMHWANVLSWRFLLKDTLHVWSINISCLMPILIASLHTQDMEKCMKEPETHERKVSLTHPTPRKCCSKYLSWRAGESKAIISWYMSNSDMSPEVFHITLSWQIYGPSQHYEYTHVPQKLMSKSCLAI